MHILKPALCFIAISMNPAPARFTTPEAPPEETAILCADQADNRIKLIRLSDPAKPTVIWRHPDTPDKRGPYMPTDAKRVVVQGVVHILASYHQRVQLVRFADKKLIRDYPAPPSCHSAECLPDGTIVTANSTDEKLRLHFSAAEYLDYPLPYAHGACWDHQRQQLWALGDKLHLYDYKDRKLNLKKSHPLPGAPTGHELFPVANADKLFVSNTENLSVFDIKAAKFHVLLSIADIKCASVCPDAKTWITQPKSIPAAQSWQTDTITSVASIAEEQQRHTIPLARFYKARWWQNVSFSYPEPNH